MQVNKEQMRPGQGPGMLYLKLTPGMQSWALGHMWDIPAALAPRAPELSCVTLARSNPSLGQVQREITPGADWRPG